MAFIPIHKRRASMPIKGGKNIIPIKSTIPPMAYVINVKTSLPSEFKMDVEICIKPVGTIIHANLTSNLPASEFPNKNSQIGVPMPIKIGKIKKDAISENKKDDLIWFFKA